MELLGFQYKSLSNFVLPSFISFFFVFLYQFALAMVPRYFSSLPFLAKLALSALLLLAVTGFGGCCRRLVRTNASAPAFVVFNVLFIWGVYLVLIRQAIPSFSDVIFNLELALLMIGYYRILCSDPGLVVHQSSGLDKTVGNIDSEGEELSSSQVIQEQHIGGAEEAVKLDFDFSFSPVSSSSKEYPIIRRVRYCKHCKAYIWGFDHHCPAFGNCIGQKNHALFMVLLVGFIIAEASYATLSTQFITESQSVGEADSETNPVGNLATSTMLFCLIQVLWQVVFLTWHIYCICYNIKTDEWINWKKYPEFQLTVQCQPGYTPVESKFRNPYDRGILGNVKEFLAASKSQF